MTAQASTQIILDADRDRLAELLQAYAHNLQDVAYQLRSNQLGDLAHQLSEGKAVPAEQWGQLLGAELQAGLTPIILLCGRLWGGGVVQRAEERQREYQAAETRAHWQRANEERERQRASESILTGPSVVARLGDEPPSAHRLQYLPESAREEKS